MREQQRYGIAVVVSICVVMRHGELLRVVVAQLDAVVLCLRHDDRIALSVCVGVAIRVGLRQRLSDGLAIRVTVCERERVAVGVWYGDCDDLRVVQCLCLRVAISDDELVCERLLDGFRVFMRNGEPCCR